MLNRPAAPCMFGRASKMGAAPITPAGALQHAHVSIAPGGAYGPDGEDFVRLSLVTKEPRIEEALDRLRRWHESRSR